LCHGTADFIAQVCPPADSNSTVLLVLGTTTSLRRSNALLILLASRERGVLFFFGKQRNVKQTRNNPRTCSTRASNPNDFPLVCTCPELRRRAYQTTGGVLFEKPTRISERNKLPTFGFDCAASGGVQHEAVATGI